MKAAKVQQVAFCSTVFKVLLQNQWSSESWVALVNSRSEGN